nr:ORF33 [Human gammaherpesvirus 8]
MASRRRKLRNFLNKECIWTVNPMSGDHIKVFNACTSISPVYDPELVTSYALSVPAYNVSVAILQHKVMGPCVAVGINGEMIMYVVSQCVSVRPVPGRDGMALIYFGRFLEEASGLRFPYIAPPPSREHVPDLTRQELVHTSQVVRRGDLTNCTMGLEFRNVNPFVWLGGGSVWLLFLGVDYMAFCPGVDGMPSLARVAALLTRCDHPDCVHCHGLRGHVNVFRGYCSAQSPGLSNTCPCIKSCGTGNGVTRVTGNRNFLGLLFDPIVQSRVTALKITSHPTPTHVENVLTGVLDDGTLVPSSKAPWVLLRMSDYFSRLLIYECKKLKALGLRSY